MQKYVPYLFILLFVACIAACGSGSTTSTATTVYDQLPLSLAPASTHMGGAVQGGPISAKFSNYSVSTFSGKAGIAGFGNYSTSNGPPAMFYHPNDITTDGANFYVADYGNSVIRRISREGVVTTLHCTDSNGIVTGFYRPSGITTDGKNIYVVDSGTNTIRFIEIATDKVTKIIGGAAELAGSIDSSVVTEVRFNHPVGITTDGVNLYVTDFNNSTVRRIVIETGAVSTLAGTSGSTGSTDGIQGVARFNRPGRITTDGTSLYLTDFYNRTIRKIDISSGTVTTLAGATGPLGSDDGTTDSTDGTGATARFYQPNGITTDGTYLYVTDSYHNTIRKINKLTGEVKTISGKAGTGGVGGSIDSPGTPSFYSPIGLTTDGVSLFVADSYNNTIRKLQ